MKNIKEVLRALEKQGFRIEYGQGSLIKIYPKTGQFYSCHLGEKALHPLRRFAKKNWNVDLRQL